LQTSHLLEACCCVVCTGSSCPHFVSASLSASDSEADLPHFWQVSLPSDSMTKCSPSGNAIGSVAGLPGRVGRGGWEVTVSVNLPGLSAPPLSALPLLWALPPRVPLLQASKIPLSLLFPRLLSAFRCVLEFLWWGMSFQLPLLLQVPLTPLLV
jgi:hypothetical protein